MRSLKHKTYFYKLVLSLLVLFGLYLPQAMAESTMIISTIEEQKNAAIGVLHASRATIFIILAIMCYKAIIQRNIMAIAHAVWLTSTAILSLLAISPNRYISAPDFSYFSIMTFMIAGINICASAEYMHRIITRDNQLHVYVNILYASALVGVLALAGFSQNYPTISSDILLALWTTILIGISILGAYQIFAEQKPIDLILLGWIPAQIGLILALGVGQNGGSMATLISVASWGCVIIAHTYLMILTYGRYHNNTLLSVSSGRYDFDSDPVSLVVDKPVFRVKSDKQKIILNEQCAQLLHISGRKSEFSVDTFKGLVISKFHSVIDQMIAGELRSPTPIQFYAHNLKGVLQPFALKHHHDPYSDILYIFQENTAHTRDISPKVGLIQKMPILDDEILPDRRSAKSDMLDFVLRILGSKDDYTFEPDDGILILLEIQYYDDWQSIYGISKANSLIKRITQSIEGLLQECEGVIVQNFNGPHIGIFFYPDAPEGCDAHIDSIKVKIQNFFRTPIIIDQNNIFVAFHFGNAKLISGNQLQEKDITDLIDTAKRMIGMNKSTDLTKVKNIAFPKDSNILSLSSDLRYAPERDQINAYYEPIIDLITFRNIGFNIQPIWRHPQYGVISDTLLRHITQRCMMENTIDRLVIAKAIEGMVKLYKAHKMPIMSFPITKKRLLNAQLDEEIQSLCDVLKVSPSLFRLEFTADCIDNNVRWLSSILYRLKSIGVVTVLNGFASTQGQLASLSSLAFDRVIIDSQFSEGIMNDERKFFALRSLTYMLKNMAIKADMHHVATKASLKYLKKAGVANVSGLAIGKEVPAERAVSLMSKPHSVISTHKIPVT